MPNPITKDIAMDRLKLKFPDWKLIEFSGLQSECSVQHKCGNIKQYKNFDNMLRTGLRCGQCEDTIKWAYNIGDIVGNIKIINRKFNIENGVRRKTIIKLYQYKCLDCGFDGSEGYYKNGVYANEHWVTENDLKWNRGCACCGHIVVQPGINDVATTDPTAVDYFLNKIESTMYSRGSNRLIQSICPICGFIQPNMVKIQTLVLHGKECFHCGSSVSYPEKFLYFMLKQINVKFYIHKVFDWSKNIVNKDGTVGNKEYDFYLPDQNLIIETHGRHHYDEKCSFSFCGAKGRTLEEEQENDRLKMNIAMQNGCNYIVINSRISRKEWMKQEIENSELSNLLNLTTVDWDRCDKDAVYGVKMNVILDKAKNPKLKIVELSNKYGFGTATIREWLKHGNSLCGYVPKQLTKTPVYSPELNFAFFNVKRASEELHMWPARIYGCLNGRQGYATAGKHPITGEPLTWERWTTEQYNKWVKNQGINFVENNFKKAKGEKL